MPKPKTPTHAPKAAPGVTQKAVKRMRRKGWMPRRIAAELGISTQAVYAHIWKIEAEEEGNKK